MGTNGESFHRLINHNRRHSSRSLARTWVHARNFGARRRTAAEVYAAFREYAADLPIVSCDLEHDWDGVLVQEWRRLGIAPIGSRGFSALRLAQRLLDPMPAGNCKLQTVRQYYRLPEREAHTALGNLYRGRSFLVSCYDRKLKPSDSTPGTRCAYAAEEWYPTRFAFGKFKGRTISEAAEKPEIRQWLQWLAGSRNAANARIGTWYLASLKKQQSNPPIVDVSIPTEDATDLVWHVDSFRNPKCSTSNCSWRRHKRGSQR